MTFGTGGPAGIKGCRIRLRLASLVSIAIPRSRMSCKCVYLMNRVLPPSPRFKCNSGAIDLYGSSMATLLHLNRAGVGEERGEGGRRVK
jgi:hypothetical protein